MIHKHCQSNQCNSSVDNVPSPYAYIFGDFWVKLKDGFSKMRKKKNPARIHFYFQLKKKKEQNKERRRGLL